MFQVGKQVSCTCCTIIYTHLPLCTFLNYYYHHHNTNCNDNNNKNNNKIIILLFVMYHVVEMDMFKGTPGVWYIARMPKCSLLSIQTWYASCQNAQMCYLMSRPCWKLCIHPPKLLCWLKVWKYRAPPAAPTQWRLLSDPPSQLEVSHRRRDLHRRAAEEAGHRWHSENSHDTFDQVACCLLMLQWCSCTDRLLTQYFIPSRWRATGNTLPWWWTVFSSGCLSSSPPWAPWSFS